MPTPHDLELALQATRDRSSFLKNLLIDALEWPIPDHVESPEDIAYTWSAADLRTHGLDKQLVAGQVWQIQALQANQPWGIFLLEFNNPDAFISGRGLTGPLRKVLRGLVPSRRQHSQLATWKRENLLFICTHQYEHFRLAYFKAPPDNTHAAPLAAFGWGPDMPARTACEFNLPALAWPDADISHADWVAGWAAAFDVEKVTKKFYADYALVFDVIEKAIAAEGDLKTDEDLRMFTQTLVNRLMFLRFLERKGWLKFKGGEDYLRALYDAGPFAKKSFYRGRLLPLFFEGLAIEQHAVSEAYGEVPFLNGGLFEPNDLDNRVKDVPYAALGGLIGKQGLFYRYNFTVEESTPLDIEVAVDPEMLGKVFEELVTGRHESGSYFTPRPVVSFMCREAIKGYLASKTKASADSIAALIDRSVVEGLTEAHGRQILDALDSLKAVDPACGSGAYLLGLLHELVRIYRLLQSEKLVKDRRSLYDLKLRIISHNLYGVDIDPFATNIAMLRLWLSLEVEADEPLPLPNLDFKIETGDSLLGPDPSAMADLFSQRLRVHGDTLLGFKEKYLTAHGAERERYRKAVAQLEKSVEDELSALHGEGVIDWRVHFADVFVRNGGFDIVLANPPYGLLNKRQNQKLGYAISAESIGLIKESDEYKPVLQGMINVCSLFIRRSFSLLRRNGIFVEIFPLAFTCDWSYGKLRSHVFRNHTIRSIDAFPERDDHRRRVFASAKMSVCIMVAGRGSDERKTDFSVRINYQPFVDVTLPAATLSPADLAKFDANCSIPLVTQDDIQALKTIYSHAVRLSEIGRCCTGEIDLTQSRKYIRDDRKYSPMYKGAIIGRFRIREKMSQGEIEYVDAAAFLKDRGKKPTSAAWHHKKSRIVLQGITGVNESIRLKMTYIPAGTFLANSANYVLLDDGNETEYLFVLAVLNTSTVNFVFKCFSTNSNVNGYEVDNLPIPAASEKEKRNLALLAQKCLKANGMNCEEIESEIDATVRCLFGLPAK